MLHKCVIGVACSLALFFLTLTVLHKKNCGWRGPVLAQPTVQSGSSRTESFSRKWAWSRKSLPSATVRRCFKPSSQVKSMPLVSR